MGIYIKHWSLADWKELLKWAKIGANNAMIGEFTEVEELPPHGRLVDEDDILRRTDNLVNSMMLFGGQIVYSEDTIKNAPTIIEAEGK